MLTLALDWPPHALVPWKYCSIRVSASVERAYNKDNLSMAESITQFLLILPPPLRGYAAEGGHLLSTYTKISWAFITATGVKTQTWHVCLLCLHLPQTVHVIFSVLSAHCCLLVAAIGGTMKFSTDVQPISDERYKGWERYTSTEYQPVASCVIKFRWSSFRTHLFPSWSLTCQPSSFLDNSERS